MPFDTRHCVVCHPGFPKALHRQGKVVSEDKAEYIRNICTGDYFLYSANYLNSMKTAENPDYSGLLKQIHFMKQSKPFGSMGKAGWLFETWVSNQLKHHTFGSKCFWPVSCGGALFYLENLALVCRFLRKFSLEKNLLF